MISKASRVKAVHRLSEMLADAPNPSQLSHERFDETHELFEKSSNQQHHIVEWLKHLVASRFERCSPLKILSVGCGSGILDRPLIQAIATNNRRVEYTGVDPNGGACGRFQRGFEKMELPSVQLKLLEQKIEAITSSDQYHFIKIVHSLYYVDDPANTLDLLLDLLAPGGIIAIVHAPNAELNQLSQCFWTRHEEKGIWFSDSLVEHLTSRGLTYSKQRIDAEMDATHCFVNDSPEGRMLLEFIIQSDCQGVDNQILEHCLSYLRSISRLHGGSILLPHPADTFVIEPLAATDN